MEVCSSLHVCDIPFLSSWLKLTRLPVYIGRHVNKNGTMRMVRGPVMIGRARAAELEIESKRREQKRQ